MNDNRIGTRPSASIDTKGWPGKNVQIDFTSTDPTGLHLLIINGKHQQMALADMVHDAVVQRCNSALSCGQVQCELGWLH